MKPPAQNTLHPLLAQRWSPRVFTDEIPSADRLMRLFEAARWAPSSRNAQPWYFLLTTRTDPAAYQAMFSLLTESNQQWAASAPVLVLAVMHSLRDNGKPHRWAPYDLGQAVAHLTFQAAAEGLSVHQMGGFSVPKAIEVFRLPPGDEPLTLLAIGTTTQPAPNDRTRKPLQDVVFYADGRTPTREQPETISPHDSE